MYMNSVPIRKTIYNTVKHNNYNDLVYKQILKIIRFKQCIIFVKHINRIDYK